MKQSDQNRTRLHENYLKLSEVGISLNPDYGENDLFEILEHHGHFDFLSILAAMGGAYGRFPRFHLSDRVWHFDTECIEDPQAYADIAYRMSALTFPDLPLSDVVSDLNFEKGVAWLEFKCSGVDYHWDLRIEEDWVDVQVFDRFCHLLNELGRLRALATCEAAQGTLFVYVNQLELDRLAEFTGTSWQWLENPPALSSD
jgi:hypothetical protein